ncbi:hypothetical protein L3Q82_015516, partial [Scortum barcoo]
PAACARCHPCITLNIHTPTNAAGDPLGKSAGGGGRPFRDEAGKRECVRTQTHKQRHNPFRAAGCRAALTSSAAAQQCADDRAVNGNGGPVSN